MSAATRGGGAVASGRNRRKTKSLPLAEGASIKIVCQHDWIPTQVCSCTTTLDVDLLLVQ